MINATEMARPFGKIINNWRHLPSTNSLIKAFIDSRKSTNVDNPIITEKGGFGGGGIAWMHECLSDDFTLVAASDQLGIKVPLISCKYPLEDRKKQHLVLRNK